MKKCKKYLRIFYVILFIYVFTKLFIALPSTFLFSFDLITSLIGFLMLFQYSMCIMNSYANGKKDASEAWKNL